MALRPCFVALDKSKHDVSAFCCDKPSMDNFLAQLTANHAQQGLSKIWVLSEENTQDKERLAAYLTLSQHGIEKASISSKKSLPLYPIPVVLLARLAVDVNYQQTGLGGKTLITALVTAYELCQQGLPAYDLVLNVLDENAVTFYAHYQWFEPLTSHPKRLFIGMKSIEQFVKGNVLS